MKKNVYILIAVLLLLNKSFSQKNNVDENVVKKEITEQDKRLLKEAKEKSEIIIEGTVIKCDEYYNKTKSAIYTLYTVKINTGIKGNYSDSIIEIVKFKDFGDEVLPIEMYPEPMKNLSTGNKIIFFTNLNKFELNENSDLAKKYYGVYKQVMIPIIQENSYNAPVAKFNSLTFMSKKDLYTEIGFFQQSLQNEKVLEAKSPITKELSDFILHTKLASSTKAKNSVVASAITFSFQNAVTTGTSVQKFYEFDVSASSSSN
ncbi:MAG: hypothetical protein ACK50A_11925 [Sphingobacteriaceae bacterium]